MSNNGVSLPRTAIEMLSPLRLVSAYDRDYWICFCKRGIRARELGICTSEALRSDWCSSSNDKVSDLTQ